MLIEIDKCIFDQEQLKLSHGYEDLDPIGKEAFVNHIHLTGEDRQPRAAELIDGWVSEMKSKFPGKRFKIYRQVEPGEITIRFHLTRKGEPDWSDSGVEIIEIET